MLDPKIAEKLRNNVISLEEYNLNDLCWTRENAIHLIHSIMEDDIGIWGGDVYRMSQHSEPLYDNWHFEIEESESMKEFYKRSKIGSLEYIKNYPAGPNDIFSIVFTERIWL